MNFVSCDKMRVPPFFALFVFFPWGIPLLQGDWSLSCDRGLDFASECENNNNNVLPLSDALCVTPLKNAYIQI